MVIYKRPRALLAALLLALGLGLFAIVSANNRPNSTPVDEAYRWFDIAPSGTFEKIACHTTHIDAPRARVFCRFHVTDYWSGFGPGDYGYTYIFSWRHGHWVLVDYGMP